MIGTSHTIELSGCMDTHLHPWIIAIDVSWARWQPVCLGYFNFIYFWQNFLLIFFILF